MDKCENCLQVQCVATNDPSCPIFIVEKIEVDVTPLVYKHVCLV